MRWVGCLLVVLVLFGTVGCGSKKRVQPTPEEAGRRQDGGGGNNGEDAGDEGPTFDAPKFSSFELLSDKAKINLGHTGFGHNIGLNKGVEIGLEVFDCEDNGFNCRFRGPVTRPNEPQSHKRCTDSLKECSTDEDCGAYECAHYLGPNFPLPTLNNICSLLWFKPLAKGFANGKYKNDTSPIQGRYHFGTGELSIRSLNVQVDTFIECGRCLGEEGEEKCAGGLTPGISCEPHGLTNTDEVISYDCLPTSQLKDLGIFGNLGSGGSANRPFSGFEVQLAQPSSPLTTQNTTWTLDGRSPNCSVGGKCWCGRCDTVEDLCREDNDCSGGETCNPIPRSEPDSCGAHPIPFAWGLYTDTACVPPANDPNNLGTCNVQVRSTIVTGQNLSCFGGGGNPNSTLTAEGMDALPDLEKREARPTVSALGCFPSTRDPTLGQIMGLPGPALLEMPLLMTW